MPAPKTKAALELELLRAEIEKTKAETEQFIASARESEAIAAHKAVETLEEQLNYREAVHRPLLNRVYHFTYDVNTETVSECIDTMWGWSTQSQEPVRLVLNSPGGSVIDGLALFDTLRGFSRRGVPVEIEVTGMAASMAAVLLQAGDVRIAAQHAELMLHEVSAESVGKASEMRDTMIWVEHLQSKLLTILAERSTLTEKEIARKWKRTDWFMDANEMLQYGFIDKVE